MPAGTQCGPAPCSSDLPQQKLSAEACDQQGQVGSSAGNSAAAPCSAASGGNVSGSDSAVSAAAPARSFVPAATASYLQPDYWDARFREEESYEWCKVRNASVSS